MKVTRPPASVETTASPMDRKVVENQRSRTRALHLVLVERDFHRASQLVQLDRLEQVSERLGRLGSRYGLRIRRP